MSEILTKSALIKHNKENDFKCNTSFPLYLHFELEYHLNEFMSSVLISALIFINQDVLYKCNANNFSVFK